MENASIQMQAHLLADDGEVEFLNEEEVREIEPRPQRAARLVAVEAPVQQGVGRVANGRAEALMPGMRRDRIGLLPLTRACCDIRTASLELRSPHRGATA